MKNACRRGDASAEEMSLAVGFLKVISEENRLRILCMLRDGERCVCEIWRSLDLSQNLASHHLKTLKDFKLIKSRKDGLKIHYSIDKREMAKCNSSLSRFLRTYEK